MERIEQITENIKKEKLERVKLQFQVVRNQPIVLANRIVIPFYTILDDLYNVECLVLEKDVDLRRFTISYYVDVFPIKELYRIFTNPHKGDIYDSIREYTGINGDMDQFIKQMKYIMDEVL